MRFRKRYVVALLGTALLLFCVIKYVVEWRRNYASPSQSLEDARQALAEHQGQVARAAETLKLERSHLYKKMRNLGLREEGGRG